MTKFLSAILLFTLSGCVDVVFRDPKIESAAQAFSNAASDCLLDVRDNDIPYFKSINCTKRLTQTSAVYTSFSDTKPVYTDEAIPRHAYIAEGAKSMAWSAAAISNAKYRDAEPVLFSLW